MSDYMDRVVEAAAEAQWNRREYRDPTGDVPDDWCPPGHDVHQRPPREPDLWAPLAAAGKYPGSLQEAREYARAAIEAAAPLIAEHARKEAEAERDEAEAQRDAAYKAEEIADRELLSLKAGLLGEVELKFLRKVADWIDSERDPANVYLREDASDLRRIADRLEALSQQPCPEAPVCQSCPASTEDDVCLPEERREAEARETKCGTYSLDDEDRDRDTGVDFTEIERRRLADPAFRDRLRRSIEENRELLERLGGTGKAPQEPEEERSAAQCSGCKRDFEAEGHDTVPIDWGCRIDGSRCVLTCPDCAPQELPSSSEEGTGA